MDDILKKIKDKRFLAKGKRGIVSTGYIDGVKVAIKEKRKESTAIYRMENEARFLKILNKEGIGPKYVDSGEDFLIYEFVEGEEIMDVISSSSKERIVEILEEIMRQCVIMDKLQINKEEMHRPLKHILVGEDVFMIDFERCSYSENPKNVTQFVQFLTSSNMTRALDKKGIKIDREDMRKKAENYKKEKKPFKISLLSS